MIKNLLSATLVAGLLSLTVGQIPVQSQTSSSRLQNARPTQLVRLTPQENARTVKPRATVSVKFAFLKGARPILPASLKLIVDGVDVTEQAQISATEDLPSSSGEIAFAPAKPFSAGKHTAEVRFANDRNQQSSYRWTFYVR